MPFSKISRELFYVRAGALSEPRGGEVEMFIWGVECKSGIKNALADVKKEWGSPSSLLEGGLTFFLQVRSTVMPLV